jgi:hypothetical protein
VVRTHYHAGGAGAHAYSNIRVANPMLGPRRDGASGEEIMFMENQNKQTFRKNVPNQNVPVALCYSRAVQWLAQPGPGPTSLRYGM